MLDLFGDWLGGVLVLLSLEEYSCSFNTVDLLCISLSFPALYSTGSSHPGLLCSIFYCFCFNTSVSVLQALSTLLSFDPSCCSTVYGAASQLLAAPDRALFYSAMLLACGVAEYLAWHRTADKNIRRKIFHMVGFLILYRINDQEGILLYYLMYSLLCFSRSSLSYRLFHSFTSETDRGHGIFSHLLLTGAVLFPRHLLNRDDYIRTLVAVCILDTATSVVGSRMRSNSKSLSGFLGGQSAACLMEYWLFGNGADLRYYLAMGLVELAGFANDNVTIPFCSVLYFRYTGGYGKHAAGEAHPSYTG